MAQVLHQSIESHVRTTSNLLKRRSFLKTGLLVSAGLSNALALGGCSSEHGTVTPGFEYLSQNNIQTLRAAIAVLLPTENSSLKNPDEVPVLQNINAMLAGMDESVRGDIQVLFDFFEYGSVLSGQFTRFSKLSAEDAVVYIEDWQGSSVFLQRAIMGAIKKFVYASYWREEATWAAVEFDGAVSKKWGVASLGNAPLPVTNKVLG